MFSNLNQPKPSGSSLFGNLGGATSSAPQSQPAQTGGSLFGGLNSSQSQQSSNLFSGLGGASKPQESSGLFGGSAASQPQQSSANPFGGLGASQPQQPSGASLFGQTEQNQTPQLTQQQQQQQNVQQPQAPALSSQPAYFDSLLERGRKRTNAKSNGNQFGELPSLQLGLGDIARRVREMGGNDSPEQQGKAIDSKAHYLLAASGISPGAALRDLNAFKAQATGTSTTQPAAAFDTDIESYVANLHAQSTLDLIADGLERARRDFDVFLEENVTMEWDAQRKRIYEHFGLVPKGSDNDNGENNSYGASIPGARGSFGRSRRGRAQELNGSKTGNPSRGSAFGTSGMQKSVIGAPGPVDSGNATLFVDVAEKAGSSGSNLQDDRFTRDKQAKLAQKVQLLNEARLQERVFPILQEFANVEAQAGGETTGQIINAYKALIEIVKENPNADSPSQPDAIKERQFADDYLDELPNSAKAIVIRKRTIDGSRHFLEKQFYQLLESTIARNPREANLGGVPTTINKIRAYVRLRALRKDLVQENTDLQMLGDDYCWALIFYMLRSGLVKEAAQYVTSNATPFKSIDRNFVTYITTYANDPDRRLTRPLQDRINAEYQQRSRIAPEHSIDPFRMACYKVIGRCELSKRSLDGIGQGVEDWIWLQFDLAREVNRVEEVAGEVFGLDEVRGVIREIGQRHFSKDAEGAGGYGTYFFLQILGGMFEQAIAYLYPYSYVAAVHFAIALDFYGLLRVSDFTVSESELLTYNTKQLPQINFGRMIGYYTRDFRAANVEAAVDYLTLICLNSDLPGQGGKSQSSLCHEALRELVLETREFAKLLGDIRSDGQRIKGAIEQRLKLISLADQEEFLRTVTIQAAAVADDNGRTTDAVLLYHLAEEYDNVIVIINRALSEAIAVEIGQEQLRLQPLKPRDQQPVQSSQQQQDTSSLGLTSVDSPAILAKNMIGLYNANALYYRKIRQINRDACGVLLRMSEVKERVEAEKWAEALDIIDTLSILPLHANSAVPLIRSAAQAFNTLPPVVARNVGNLLMWTITCCGRQRDVLRNATYEDRTRKEMADTLLMTTKDLMVFAGLIRYKLPPKVFEVLARAGQDVGVY
ncbi:MAG: hypothetical protein M1827_005954 [Pycnora praestabilis]|nr:MAG: hypothetical protein M1827_005954 [Pycnora praestabilis]